MILLHKPSPLILTIVVVFALTFALFPTGPDKIPQKLLRSASFPVQLPALKDGKSQEKAILYILQNEMIDPAALDAVTGEPQNIVTKSWKEFPVPSDGKISLSSSGGAEATEEYFSFFITASTFVPAKLSVESDAALIIYIDDAKKVTSKKGNPDTLVTYDQELKLTTGVHRVIIRTISAKTDNEKSLKIKFSVDEAFEEDIELSLRPEKLQTVLELLDDEKISSISLSTDGSYAAVSTNTYNHNTKKNDVSLYIYRTADRKQILYNAASSSGRITWSKKHPAKYWYTESNGSETNIRIADVVTGENSPVVTGIKDYTGFRLPDDESYILIFKDTRAKESSKNYKRYNSPNDRWPWSGSKNALYIYDFAKMSLQPVMDFERSVSVQDISPSGNKWLLTVSDEDLSQRPFSITTCMEYNYKTGVLDTIKSFNWFNRARYLNEGSIVFAGGPSMFGEIGIQTDNSLIPNEYDTQIYLYTIASGSVKSLSKEFNPAIQDYTTAPDGKTLHILAEEGSMQLYNILDIQSGVYKRVPLAVDYINDLEVSSYGLILYQGSGAVTHNKVYLYKGGKSEVLFDPAPHMTRHYKQTRTEALNYSKSDGTVIEGLLYYPVDFDKSKKYPCIVFYYGGTSPTSREFEGRYPKNLWTANGYFVYVVQPSGATGYGQKFSALHVNDWGKTSSDEIINAANELIKKIPAVDSSKLGCIGASYGGFMTMTLLTKTNRFAAAVSHAGISNLPSYWGIGYWGYLYSAMATAGSYPWNRKDIYVDLSPIFHADKVSTPLLLLHGNSDTNVPPGESMQFYTALKLLGKEVELIEIDKQDHHILEHDKRKFWTELIISWFNKKLKNQPLYWNYLLEAKE